MSHLNMSIPRREYWNDRIKDPHLCPECGTELQASEQTYLLDIQQGKKSNLFYLRDDSGMFCPKCPVVVLDFARFDEETAAIDKVTKFVVAGIMNVDDLPAEQQDFIPEGEDEAFDARFVEFAAPLSIKAEPKIGRNEPCPCGSGKKYKKCCGVSAD